MTENFCRGFLLRHTEYEHIHGILDNYSVKYNSIDTDSLFTSKESLNEAFPAICRTLIRERGDGPSYILALLGFAFHVHTKLQDSAADWYDMDILLKTLIDLLICNNFNPINYTRNRSFCNIL